MSEKEILVEHGSTTTPWLIPPDIENFMDGRIVPRSWRFSNDSGKICSYEFAFERHNDIEISHHADPAAHQQFTADLYDILQKHDLTSILGLVTVAPDYLPTRDPNTVKCEKIFGRANVVFEIGSEALKDKHNRTSIWTFGKDSSPGRESMICFSGCACSVSEDDFDDAI